MQAETLSRQTGRPMLVFFTAEWCKYCHQLADETLSLPEVEELTRSFICVRIDADRQPDVCKALGIRSFPTLLCIGPQGQLQARIVGKQPTAQVMATLQNALQVPAQARVPGVERR
ncbi:MAG: thioredoxin family protein [Pirellulales bacterium]